MEWAIAILMLGIAALVAAAAVYIPREVSRAQMLPGGSQAGIDALRLELEARFEAEIERFRQEAREAFAEIGDEVEQLRTILHDSALQQHAHVDQLRQRSSDLDGRSIARVESALLELRAHHDAELARLQANVHAALSQGGVPQAHGTAGHPAASALTDLYERLVALDVALGAAIDPELLPGETLQTPIRLRAELLAWENWKEVGDAAFVFAQTFAAQRVKLDTETEDALAGFIVQARTLLTRGIYPNLQAIASDPQAKGRAEEAATSLVAAVQAADSILARSYRALVGSLPPASA